MNNQQSIIVIGSGPTGAIAALNLVSKGIPVTMLESGQRLPKGLLIRLWGRNAFRKIPPIIRGTDFIVSADPETSWTYTLEPGGLSNHWTGAVPRFAPEDFVEGEKIHERYRWPLTYPELVPYYVQVEKLMKISGGTYGVPTVPASVINTKRTLPGEWKAIARQAEKLGHSLIPVPLAEGPNFMIKQNARAFNSFTTIIPLLMKFPHFKLILGGHAICLEWSGQKKRVEAVIYRDRATNTDQRLTGQGVVLAAGALASTKLLLDSECADFPQGLGNSNGLLGLYLHDHPSQWFVLELDKPIQRLSHPAYLTREVFEKSAPLFGASFTFSEFASSHFKKALALTPLKTHRLSVNSFSTMVPLAENYIKLAPDTQDEFGLPKIDIHIKFRPEVYEFMDSSRNKVQEILKTAGYENSIKQLHIKPPGEAIHYGGTVRMHSSPEHGLLNSWNQLNDINNVVVVDSSCFTTSPEKNPLLTAMALAARAADHLAEDLKSGH